MVKGLDIRVIQLSSTIEAHATTYHPSAAGYHSSLSEMNAVPTYLNKARQLLDWPHNFTYDTSKYGAYYQYG